ncbi:hypothetical protein TRFO_09819 [Tritrichomonas foetus]|uniref:Importin N-terminal domain-containing protein n=1 Tax=Tritrichomonas foetus TaxID=1144522 RepID=A0A1J4JDD4_9EUKA|nr:hypothetical protein TRFO_09819 [Tritrichomonas foetus]|eukprot:OHS96665.1 hypothetical protein TRFO_09819 [Tritrichomonas foetus]
MEALPFVLGNISLNDGVVACLNEFTNPNNEIRMLAENGFIELSIKYPKDVILILINIIKSNSSSNIAFSALIQLNRLITKGCSLFPNENERIFDESFLYSLRNQITQFYLDKNFPKTLHEYLYTNIWYFYIFAKNGINPPYPEFWDFLLHCFQTPEYYADALYFYKNLYSVEKEIVHQVFNQPNIEYVLNHLNSPNFEDKVNSIGFLLEFWKNNSQLISQLPILPILQTLPDELFNKLLGYIDFYLPKGIVQIPTFPSHYYELLFSKILDDSNDELLRVKCLYSITNTAIYMEPCYQALNESFPQVLAIISQVASNPIQFPALYEECFNFLKCLLAFTDIMSNHTPLFIRCTENPNYYVSSLFLRLVINPAFIQKGLFFASQNDHFVRENGLRFLKTLIKRIPNELVNETFFIEIGYHLFNVFDQFHDSLVLSVLKNWILRANPNVILQIFPLIIKLCVEYPSIETVQCGAALCRTKTSITQILNSTETISSIDFDEFVMFLLNTILKIASSDPKSMSLLINSLPMVTREAGLEKTVSFMNNAIVFICSDYECLFSKGMTQLCNQLQNSLNLYSEPILSQLFRLFDEAKDDLALQSKILLAFSKIGVLFNNFEKDYFPRVFEMSLNLLELIKCDKNTDKENVIKAIKYFIIRYGENEAIYNKVFTLCFSEILTETDINSLRCYLKLILHLIKFEDFFTTEKIQYVVQNFFPLINQIYTVLVNMKNSEKLIDTFENTDIDSMASIFLEIFNVLLDKIPDEVIKVVSLYFMENTFDIPSFRYLIYNIWCDVLTQPNPSVITGIASKLIENLFKTLQSSEIEEQTIVLKGCRAILYTQMFTEEHINYLFAKCDQIFNLYNDTEFQENSSSYFDSASFLYLSMFLHYVIGNTTNINNTPNANDILNRLNKIISLLPNCSRIGDISFKQIIKIVEICIESNLEHCVNSIIAILCNKIRKRCVDDRILRSFLSQQPTMNPCYAPLFAEIERFL